MQAQKSPAWLVFVPCLAAVALGAAPVGATFTYQGQLKLGGLPLNDTVDIIFMLYDAPVGGNQVGHTLTISAIDVVNGLFTVELDFGAGAFIGEARWLEIQVRTPAGSGAYTLLTPRQKLTPAPSALSLRLPFDGQTNASDFAFRLINYGSGNAAVFESYGGSDDKCGVMAISHSAGVALYGYTDGTSQAARFDNANASSGAETLYAGTWGLGYAGKFQIKNASNTTAALYATTDGIGPAIQGDGMIHSLRDGFKFPDGSVQTAAATGSDFWSLSGNADTTPGTHFLGTTDKKAVEVKVDGRRALRIEPAGPSIYNDVSPNIVAGSAINFVTKGVVGATIAGGGLDDLDVANSDLENTVTDFCGTVGGGAANQAGDAGGTTDDAPYATVSGGVNNRASGKTSTVGGGDGNTASARTSTVGGGYDNNATGIHSTISGGNRNTARTWYSTVGGGTTNAAAGDRSTVAGGGSNVAGNVCSGGDNHGNPCLATEDCTGGTCVLGRDATVGGGNTNRATGHYSTVPGGSSNQAGGDYSFAAGRRARVRPAGSAPGGSGDSDGDQGTFVWADSTDADVTSTGPNQFLIRAGGGVGINTNAPTDPLTVNGVIRSMTGGFEFPDGSVQTAAATTSNFWSLSGNAGTTPGTHFLGTTDTAELVLKVGNEIGLSLEQGYGLGSSPNVVGGHEVNYVTSQVNGAAIGGGGYRSPIAPGTPYPNRVTDNFGTVAGGAYNRAGDSSGTTADASYASVGGGNENLAGGAYSSVPGGRSNSASEDYSFAAGRRAKANHQGAFVWADSTDADFTSTRPDHFRIRASGGFEVVDPAAPGNDSVVLPAGAVSAAETSDEAGVASDIWSGADVPLTGGGPFDRIAGRALTAPASGYVLVIGTCEARLLHANGTGTSVFFGVSNAPATVPSNQDVRLYVSGTAPTGVYEFPITVHGLFSAAAGPNTFYLLARETSGDVAVSNMQLTLVYFPTAYGTVTPTLLSSAASGGSDFDASGSVDESQVDESGVIRTTGRTDQPGREPAPESFDDIASEKADLEARLATLEKLVATLVNDGKDGRR